MTTETIPGTKAIATRLVNGERDFEMCLREIAGVTEDESIRMRQWMTKNKLVTRDFCLGRISVKHGAYLDADVLLKIRDEAMK